MTAAELRETPDIRVGECAFNLMSRHLAHSGVALSIVAMMKRLTDIQQVTLLYPARNARNHRWSAPSCPP